MRQRSTLNWGFWLFAFVIICLQRYIPGQGLGPGPDTAEPKANDDRPGPESARNVQILIMQITVVHNLCKL